MFVPIDSLEKKKICKDFWCLRNVLNRLFLIIQGPGAVMPSRKTVPEVMKATWADYGCSNVTETYFTSSRYSSSYQNSMLRPVLCISSASAWYII